MRVKVLKFFRDKHTKTLYKPNTEIEITKKRLDEMKSTSYGILVEEVKTNKKK